MQGSHSSWLVAIAVMALGVIVSLPFHQETPPPSSDPVDFSHFSEGLIWQEDTYVADSTTLGSPHRRLGPLHRDGEVTSVAANESVDTKTTPPPRMEGQYGGLAEKYGTPLAFRSPSDVKGRSSEPDFALRGGSNSLASGAEPSRVQHDISFDDLASHLEKLPGAAARTAPLPQVAGKVPSRTREDRSVTPPRLHRIVDGDTLESIAARYLGDPSRAEEIFMGNRDVLSSPDLLPVGKQLRVRNSSTSQTIRQEWRRPPTVAAPTRVESDVPERTGSVRTPIDSADLAPRTHLQPLR